MSFNILREDLGGSGHTWTDRKEAVLEMIATNNPGVMGLQECSWTEREDILAADSRRKATGVSVFNNTSGYTAESSNTIVYRSDLFDETASGTFWLSDTPDYPSYTWDASKPRTCTWVRLKSVNSEEEFYYFNAHLQNTVDGVGLNARTKSVELILKQMSSINSEGLPMIFGGDMNAVSTESSLAPMKSSLTEARTACADTDTGRTFNSFGETATSVIDHLFFKRGTASRFYVDRNPYQGVTYVSDHYPIFCDLVLQ